MKKYDPAELKRLLAEGLIKGKTVADISRETRIPYATLYHHAKSAKEYLAASDRISEVGKKVLYLHKELGETPAEITAKLGISRQGVHYWLQKLRDMRMIKPRPDPSLLEAQLRKMDRQVLYLARKANGTVDKATFAGLLEVTPRAITNSVKRLQRRGLL